MAAAAKVPATPPADQPTGQPAAQNPIYNPLGPAPTGLEDLSRRVASLEQRVGGMLSGKVAEISQEEKDRRTVGRRPNSYQEAVEYEAAKDRLGKLDQGRTERLADSEAAKGRAAKAAGSDPTGPGGP